MDFRLSDEDQTMLRMFEEVGKKVVGPWAKKAEAGEHPAEAIAGLAEAGLVGMIAPEEYGGGGTYLQLTLAMEVLGKYSPAIAEHLNMSNCNLILPILTYGTEEQKKSWLPRIASGDAYCAFALTEPDAGSDTSGMTTKAEKQGDFYVVNGRKCFISGAPSANLFMVFAVTSAFGATKKEITAFILDTKENAEGVSFGQEEPTMGMIGASVCDMYFDNVRIPVKNVLGAPGNGFKAAMIGLNPGRCALSALAIGIAQRAVDETVAYVKERKMFGKTLAAFQNTQFVLAEAQTKVNAARLLIHQAAVTLDQKGDAAQMCAEAKWFATETAKAVVDSCLQFFGGYGYIKGFPIEQMYRDVRVFTIFEGATEVQKHTIAKFMGLR